MGRGRGDGRREQADRRRHRGGPWQRSRQELRRSRAAPRGGCQKQIVSCGGQGLRTLVPLSTLRPIVESVTSLLPWITNGPLITIQVMSGLSVGMFLFLVSVGMSLIFGVTRVVNL